MNTLELVGVAIGLTVIAAVIWNLRDGVPPSDGRTDEPPTTMS